MLLPHLDRQTVPFLWADACLRTCDARRAGRRFPGAPALVAGCSGGRRPRPHLAPGCCHRRRPNRSLEASLGHLRLACRCHSARHRCLLVERPSPGGVRQPGMPRVNETLEGAARQQSHRHNPQEVTDMWPSSSEGPECEDGACSASAEPVGPALNGMLGCMLGCGRWAIQRAVGSPTSAILAVFFGSVLPLLRLSVGSVRWASPRVQPTRGRGIAVAMSCRWL